MTTLYSLYYTVICIHASENICIYLQCQLYMFYLSILHFISICHDDYYSKYTYLQVSTSLGSQLDFFTTFADIAGISLKSLNKTLDSHSLVSVLFNETKSM